jgi:hypothetical protein
MQQGRESERKMRKRERERESETDFFSEIMKCRQGMYVTDILTRTSMIVLRQSCL